MTNQEKLMTKLPDVAGHVHESPQGTLDWVGMSEISMPLLVQDGDVARPVDSLVQIYVNLADAHVKGIHMSRLYRTLGRTLGDASLTPGVLSQFLDDLQATHDDSSTCAFVEFKFERLINKQALVSENSGWNRYPVKLRAVLDAAGVRVEQETLVHYSSTCPASAALARSVIQDQFERDFGHEEKVTAENVHAWLGSQDGIVATPHGQRSTATVKVQLPNDESAFPISAIVTDIEEALGTPVQTAVKREDEQEFALRNGQNPMFCEDAARRLKQMLIEHEMVEDFLVRVDHFESLHAHNAVSMVAKGIPNGYRAQP